MQTLLEQGVIDRLVQIMKSGEPDLVLNALWAFKNLLYKATLDLKRQVMGSIGWTNMNRCVLPGIRKLVV